jgi:uncharacterized cupin superfamily protein
MPKIDIAKAHVRTTTIYPDKFKHVCDGREKTMLGDVVGLTQFGVNLTRLKPGAASSLRHWHAYEDEFVYVLEGEVVLVEDGGETVLKPGDAAGWKAGVADAHCLVNRSARDAVILEVGTRARRERVEYPDHGLVLDRDEGGAAFKHASGEPYA